MNSVNGKRITFKRTRPNPLFQDWLQQLHEEAKAKKSKLEIMLNEALESLSKYPLSLQSGAECAILRGFDKRLCLYIDKRLEAYKTLNIDFENELCTAEYIESPKDSQNSQNSSYSLNSSQQLEHKTKLKQYPKDICNAVSPGKRKGKVKYKPVFRSGSYAILMALLDHTTHSSKQSLGKDELINKAQKYCEESFTKPKPETHYTAWSNMKRLITKGLVKKTGNKKSQFSLTEEGITLANELLIDTQNTPSMNDIIFKDNTYNKEININSDIIVLDEISAKIDNKLNKKKDFEVLYSDKLIEMEPSSFDIILLIDKNETGG